ncbi:MAG: ECF-type sigma factor [Gemmatimonadota bacterium]
MADSTGSITRLVQQWSDGEDGALDALVHLVYDDLRVIAHHHLRTMEDDSTLHTTALVHETYLRLDGVHGGAWKSRGHFFAFCSTAMRRVLIDYARRHQAAKRGRERTRVPLEEVPGPFDAEVVQVLAVDEALRRLVKHDERMATIVECRFFGGLTVAETAEALEVSTRSIEREWARARVYLHRLLEPGSERT